MNFMDTIEDTLRQSGLSLVKAVGRFDPYMKTRWVAPYLGAPLRATKNEAIADLLNWYREQAALAWRT